MNSFVIGGERIRVLDMDAERGHATKNHSTEERRTFDERADEEKKCSTIYERQHKFLTIYSSYCEPTRIVDPEKAIRIALVAQSSAYPTVRRRLTTTIIAITYVNREGIFQPLWKLRRFEPGKPYPFLSKGDLMNILSPLFKKVTLTLGTLTHKEVKAIAWQLDTDEGLFYIPWHSGIIIENSANFTFEEKTLGEMDGIYEHLCFGTTNSADTYRIICD